MAYQLMRLICRAGLLVSLLLNCHLFAQTPTIPPCATPTAPCDDIPPNLLSLSYPTTPVNAQTQNQTGSFIVTAIALDPLSGTELSPPKPGGVASGVYYASITFQSSPCSLPSPQTTYAYATLYPQGAFTPGVAQTISGPLYFDTNAVSGNYHACSASIADVLGNSQVYYENTSQSSFLLQALPPISVVSIPPPDTTPPVLHGLSITPTLANLTSSPATFTAILTTTDDILPRINKGTYSG